MSNNIRFVELAAYEAPKAVETNRDKWVDFKVGYNGNFFDFLIERYNNSTTNHILINSISKLVYGRGISATDANKKPNDYATLIKMFSKECLKNVIKDRKLLGNAAFQVIYSADKKSIVRAEHIPAQNLRAEKCNDKGEITGYYYSDNWNDIKKFKPYRIPAFGFGGQSEKLEILYIKPYTIGQKYYANVDYFGCVPYSVLEEEIAAYLINDVQNGFSGTKVINFNNGVPDEEKQELIASKVKSKVTGSKGEKVIVSFNSDETKKTTIESVPLDDAPAHYAYLSEESRNKIMLGHGVTSGLLFGIPSSNGFSSNADEMKNAFNLFDNMVIKPMQDEILEAIDKLLAYNKIYLDLYFKTLQPLEFFEPNTTIPAKDAEKESGLELSAQINAELKDIIDRAEPFEQEGWSIVDEREVVLEDEDILDEHLNKLTTELEKENLSLFSKIYNFISTGSAKPDFRSEQDKKVKEKFFKVRYRYTGNKSPERDFCAAMMSANKLYRKEDIEDMSRKDVNPGFGEGGSNKYDIFRFKGGPRCHHKWQRVTMVLDLNATGKGYKDIGTRAAEIEGFKVTNPFEVSIYPNNLPLKGFSPRNKNLPADVE